MIRQQQYRWRRQDALTAKCVARSTGVRAPSISEHICTGITFEQTAVVVVRAFSHVLALYVPMAPKNVQGSALAENVVQHPTYYFSHRVVKDERNVSQTVERDRSGA